MHSSETLACSGRRVDILLLQKLGIFSFTFAMETLIDILLILVLIGLASLPIILFMFYALIRRMHNDWTHFIAEYSVNIENKDMED